MTAAYQHNGQTVSAEAFYAVACDPRRNVAVEACAGAGKTWMLVSRILRALLDGAAPHEILAITFTKRAASEMSERLYQWLEAFAHADADTLARELMLRGVIGKNGLLPTQNQRELLSNLYRAVLATGRKVQIRTFHGWFAALLRGAPLAVLQHLSLPANYELLEDDSKAIALVWRRFYAGLLADPDRKADFEALVFAHGRFQTDKALQAALDKRVEFALADAHGVVDVSVLPFGDQFPEFAGLGTPEEFLTGIPAHMQLMGAAAKALGGASAPTFSAKGVELETALTEGNLAAAFAALLTEKGTPRKFGEKIAGIATIRQVQELVLKVVEARHQCDAWAYQHRMARLTRVLIADFAEVKREQGWVDMNDVERAALVLLGDPVLSGWVQQRLDARIRHLLIDEFQDTNPLQWQALLSWLGSYAGSGGGSAPSVFIVGDPKQSIYRFRRAEPQVFKAALAFVHDELGGDVLSCDHTRRNANRIIATVNTAMQAAVEGDGYAGFRAHTTGSDAVGQVFKLPPIPRDSASKADDGNRDDIGSELPGWRDSLTVPREVPEETLRTLEARQAARWIAQQLSQSLKPQDVMALSRKRAGLGPLQDELRTLGIAARIGEKTELIDCCEVQDIVALLDVLVSPQHDLSLARVLKSPLFNLSDEALVQLAKLKTDGSLAWFDLLQKQELLTPVLQGLSAILLRWKAWVDQLPPHDALQAIYSDGDVLARFAQAAPAVQRDAVLANLRALLGVSLQLGGGRFATPYTFVRALKAGGVQAPAAVLDDAVRLLTIHGAKGLEAQAVLLLDTDTSPRNSDTMSVLVDWPGEAAVPRKFIFLASESRPPACAANTLQIEVTERQREELNALYVAITRAKHTLAISSIEPAKLPERSWWARLSPLADEVQWPAAAGDQIDPVGETLWAPGTSDRFYIKDLPLAHVDIASTATKNEAKPMASEDTDSSRIGQAMHRLLQWGDAGRANAMAAAREFKLTPDQGEAAAAMARRILAGEGAWAWDRAVVDWQGDEVELVREGSTLRLDRLVQRRDTGEWWVLDHKSTPAPQDDPGLVEQLRNYRDAVCAIYPGQVVRAAFLTGQGRLVEPF